MIFFAMTTLCLIDEPKQFSVEKRNQDGYFAQMWKLSVFTIKAAKSNKLLIVGWILYSFSIGPMVMFDIFVQSWLQGLFANGVIQN